MFFNKLAKDACDKDLSDRTKMQWFKESRKQIELFLKVIGRHDKQVELAAKLLQIISEQEEKKTV